MPLLRTLHRTLIASVCLVLGSGAFAQTPATGTAPSPPLRIYLDCWQCDSEHLRQNVTFIEYVRDRAAADLHVLVTTQSTGGGGTAWNMAFIGLGRFYTRNLSVVFNTPQSATGDDQRREFARRFRLALAGYASDTAVARDLTVTFTPPSATEKAKSGAAARDPWHRWLFRLSGSANGNGEAATKSVSYRGSVSASRVTDSLKINFSMSGSESEREFTLSDGRVVRTNTDSWNFSHTTVKTVGRRFAAGVRIAASHSSFDNRDRLVAVYPGFEFNVFSYDEYERRRLTFWYEAGPNYYNYSELTIFDKLKETVPKQQLDVRFSMRQPWGYAGISTNFSQHLDRRDRYNAGVFGDADIRIVKGLAFNMWGSYSKIKDQIALPKQGATEEEILLQIRQLETNYSYSVGMGISYSFGSIFTSVVNPRFGGTNVHFF